MFLLGAGYCHQLGEVQSPSIPESGVSRGDPGFHSFQGFSLPSESREAMLNRRRILVLGRAASFFLVNASRGTVLLDSFHSGRQVADAIPTAPSSPSVGSGRRLHSNSLGFGLPPGISLAQVNPHLDFWSDASDVGWGAQLLDATASGLWSPKEALLSINARELLAVEYGLHHFRLLVSNSTVAVFSDFHSPGLPSQAGGHSIASPQLHISEDPPLGGDDRLSPGPSIHPGQEQCSSGLPVLFEPGPGVRMD